MEFIFGKQDLRSLRRAQEHSFLLTNGLGGYASLTAAFSSPRCDQGVLVGALCAPNVRVSLVHRICERLTIGETSVFLSSQEFAGRTPPEDGFVHLSSFADAYGPCFVYDVRGVHVTRRMAMAQGKNAVCVVYAFDNHSGSDAHFCAEPLFLMAPKGDARQKKTRFSFDGRCVRADGLRVYIDASAALQKKPVRWERLSYPEDGKDGRAASGLCASVLSCSLAIPAGQSASLSLVFSMEDEAFCAEDMLLSQETRQRGLAGLCGLCDPVARRLARAADAYLSHKEATGGMTLLAGYPLFGDWGRDTMIALPGCALSAGRLEEAKSILETFLAFECDGLVPNLFPEGGAAPMYNTADAALLLVNAVYLYYRKTGDLSFVSRAFPVLHRIVSAYERGTRHGIRMDEDALIMAGEGMDQVTWMDVRIGDILPTPRHGKPVEINAYWYSALRVMETFAALLGEDSTHFGLLAARCKSSFLEKFPTKSGGLRDVLCGGAPAETQIRPNQIWALTQPFTMLPPELERSVVDVVYAHLYTPCGLRSLSPDDPQFRGAYGGSQLSRDLAYHQGTVWVFPLGAFYLAFLKVHGGTPQAARRVREMLAPVAAMLREGCVGQLPEIYEGANPGEGKGCFAQAWSVGELLRVYEMLEQIENTKTSSVSPMG